MAGISFKYMMYISYLFWSTCTSIIVRVLLSWTHIISSVSVCMNAPGMLHVSTSLFSLAYITRYRKMDSFVMVVEIVSPFFWYNIWFLPSAHRWPLIFSQRFSWGRLDIQAPFSSFILLECLGSRDVPLLVCIVA